MMAPNDEKAAFLAAIHADPDSDLPRLVFARWLEEQGDPSGKFIRIQCQLAHMEPDDRARDELERQQEELLIRHREDWVGNTSPTIEVSFEEYSVGNSPRTVVVSFDRGLPQVKVTAEVLAEKAVSAWFLARRSSVCDLALDVGDDESLRRVLSLGLLTDVLTLKLTSNYSEGRFTDAGLAHLTGLHQLRTLILACTGVTDAGLRHLAELAELHEL